MKKVILSTMLLVSVTAIAGSLDLLRAHGIRQTYQVSEKLAEKIIHVLKKDFHADEGFFPVINRMKFKMAMSKQDYRKLLESRMKDFELILDPELDIVREEAELKVEKIQDTLCHLDDGKAKNAIEALLGQSYEGREWLPQEQKLKAMIHVLFESCTDHNITIYIAVMGDGNDQSVGFLIVEDPVKKETAFIGVGSNP